jgi:hypothetical protein
LPKQVLHVRESHSDSELIAALRRATPFQKRSAQQFDLVLDKQFTRRDRMLQSQFSSSQ